MAAGCTCAWLVIGMDVALYAVTDGLKGFRNPHPCSEWCLTRGRDCGNPTADRRCLCTFQDYVGGMLRGLLLLMLKLRLFAMCGSARIRVLRLNAWVMQVVRRFSPAFRLQPVVAALRFYQLLCELLTTLFCSWLFIYGASASATCRSI